MKRRWLIVFVGLLALIQAYFVSGATSSRFSVNLVLVALFFIVTRRSLRLALSLAVLGGSLLDIAAGQFGPRILLFVAMTLLIWWFMQAGLEMNRRLNQIILIIGLSVLYNAALFLLSWSSLGQAGWQTAILGWWFLEAVLTAAVVWVFGGRIQSRVELA